MVGSLWLLVRRPLLLLFAMGFASSLSSSPRLSVRTTVDGMISFLFLAVAELLAATYLYVRSDRRVPLAKLVDDFFVTNRPWLLWILIFCAWESMTGGLPISLTGATAFLATLAVPAVWAAYLDRRLLRDVLGRQSVTLDLCATRAITWGLALVYFFGIAVYADVVDRLR